MWRRSGVAELVVAVDAVGGEKDAFDCISVEKGLILI